MTRMAALLVPTFLSARAAMTIVVLLACPAANGQEAKRSFPDALFGVKLGTVHQLGQSGKSKDVGTLPIKEFKGANQFLGHGVHYYFKPLKQYPAFKYIERREKPDDKYFRTSFRLYLLPLISENASAKDVEPNLLRWEVALVEWSEEDKTKKKDDAYYWAMDFCKSLQIDLGRKADIFDSSESHWYTCTFTEGNSELNANSLGGAKYFTLKYSKSVFEQKEKVIDTAIRKLQMNAIRPY